VVNEYSQRSGVTFSGNPPAKKPTFKFNPATGKLEPL